MLLINHVYVWGVVRPVWSKKTRLSGNRSAEIDKSTQGNYSGVVKVSIAAYMFLSPKTSTVDHEAHPTSIIFSLFLHIS